MIQLSDLPPPPSGKTGWPWTEGPSQPPPENIAWPKISLITPSYNQGHYIEETLRSHGAVVSRGGESDRWDLQIRAGLFGGGRLLMGVEEHGGGKRVCVPYHAFQDTVLLYLRELMPEDLAGGSDPGEVAVLEASLREREARLAPRDGHVVPNEHPYAANPCPDPETTLPWPST